MGFLSVKFLFKKSFLFKKKKKVQVGAGGLGPERRAGEGS